MMCVWHAKVQRMWFCLGLCVLLPCMHPQGYKTYIMILYVMVVTVYVCMLALAWLTLAMRKQVCTWSHSHM